tara:strand:+ start:1661 stop:1831 length:171 start_codon:yes stop_codon:yes gene_type:complete
MHYKKAEEHPYNTSMITIERRLKNLLIAKENATTKDMKDIWEDKHRQMVSRYIRTT